MKENAKMKKLNVGCGKNYRKGWTNLDIDPIVKPDVIFDLKKIEKDKKTLFKNNTFDLILLSHIIEHFFDPNPILEEMYRICKVGGIIEIKVPYGDNGYNHIDHKKFFTLGTFNITEFGFSNNVQEKVKRIYSKLYISPSENNFLGKLKQSIYRLVLRLINNLIKKSDSFYDMTILRYLFPQTNIHVKFRKIK